MYDLAEGEREKLIARIRERRLTKEDAEYF
jgi:hypothetical protein